MTWNIFKRKAGHIATEKAAISAVTHEYPPDKLPKQLTMYLLVGALSLGAEFLALNFFLYLTHLPLIAANTLAMSVGLVVTYFTDKEWVFRRSKKPTKKHFVLFVVITAVGLYGLQNGLLYLMAVYPEAQNATASFVHSIIGHISVGATRANVAKTIASTLAGIFNFFLYRKYVFVYAHKRPPTGQS